MICRSVPSGDIDSITENGVYQSTNEAFGYGLLLHISGGNYYVAMQVFFPVDINSRNKFKFRLKTTNSWAAWKIVSVT